MTTRMRMVAVLALTVAGLAGSAVLAKPYSARQYYGSWQKHPQKNFHFRHYYYKPTPTFAGYKHHFVVHNSQKPRHLYFYNPYKKQFWGRCPTETNGKPLYSMLAEKDRKEKLEDIDESAFPAPGPVPPVPEATDDATLELPPDDLPGNDRAPN